MNPFHKPILIKKRKDYNEVLNVLSNWKCDQPIEVGFYPLTASVDKTFVLSTKQKDIS